MELDVTMTQFDLVRTAGAFNQFAARLDAQAGYLRDIALNASRGGAEDAASLDSESAALAAQHARALRQIGRPLLSADAMGLTLQDFPVSEARRMETLTRTILDLQPDDSVEPVGGEPELRRCGKELIRNLQKIIESEQG